MKAIDVLEAIHRHHSDAAIVHEVVLDDPTWLDTYTPGDDFGTKRRIDALMIKAGLRTAIEVKVSRADFARETERKRGPWRLICHRFVYATPVGLLNPDEIPDGIGLWEAHPRDPFIDHIPGRLTVAKRARVNKSPGDVPEQLFVAMCYRAMRSSGELAS